MWFKKKEVTPPKKMKRVKVCLEDMVIGEIYFPFESIKIKDCGRLVKIDGDYITLEPVIQDFIQLPIGMKDVYCMNKDNCWPMYKEIEDTD